MIQLQELASMLGENHLPVGTNKMDLRVKKLHKYLKTAQHPSDEEAAKVINTEGGSSTFRKAKHHLKLALINGVLAINPSKKGASESRIEANNRMWDYVQGARSGVDCAEHVFVNAIEDNLPDVRNFDLQEPLVVGALTVMNSSNQKSLRKSQYLEFLKMVEVELEYDYKLQVCYKHSRHSTFMNITRRNSEDKVEYLTKALKEIQPFSGTTRFRAEHIYLKLMLRLKMEQGRYEDAITFAKDTLKTFDKRDSLQKQAITIFQNTLTRAYLVSGRCEEGLTFSLYVLNETNSKDVFTYYIAKELVIVMAMRTGRYQLAYEHYLDVLKGSLGAGLASNYEETLAIIEAYLVILIEFGLINISEQGAALTRLRLGKFLNETSVSQKEKSLRNIHIIIIKILNHALFKRDMDFDQADAIRKYVQRHLNDPDTARAKNFILALIKFPENGYNKEMVARESAKYLERLRSYKVGEHHQHPYGEIVLYENIWQHLIKI